MHQLDGGLVRSVGQRGLVRRVVEAEYLQLLPLKHALGLSLTLEGCSQDRGPE